MDAFLSSTKTTQQILRELGTNTSRGLSDLEAKNRLLQHGANDIEAHVTRWWHILLRQFQSPFTYLLIAAAAISFFLGELLDGGIIFLFIALNASLGFYQEFRSEKTLSLLKTFVASRAKVLRNGQIQMVTKQSLVPGDIVALETGDKIPADLRFIETHNLAVDESVLTGESLSAKKNDSPLKKKPREYYQADNLGFSGTHVVSGKARGVVIGTGNQSAIGSIAKLTLETHHTSNFEKGIASFSSVILHLVIITVILLFLINLFLKGGKTNIGELIIFSIALAVSVIPEALPVVTTFSLAKGALLLAKQKVVVKRLSAIEDLGGIEVLCTDKTGTLTENKLTVDSLLPGSSPQLVFYANLAASSLEKIKLEPFDIAIAEALPMKEKNKLHHSRRINETPFAPEMRRNTVLIKTHKNYELVSRGAPETIITLCKGLSRKKQREIRKWVMEKGKQGMRVIAVARKTISTAKAGKIKNKLQKEEVDMEWMGIMSFVDPIKESAFVAVKRAKELGIDIKIITGDNKEVAGAVAHTIDLISSPDQVITGEEFIDLNAAKQRLAVRSYSVFARISPSQKYKIIELLQENYDLGFLGEGINDAPAIKIAGVSLVVESAADIAREAADIVLLKKDLKVIIDGVEEGRRVFTNTVKYIRATLASNFGNFYAVAISSLLIPFLPMLPVQIFLVNLLTDFPMIAISTDNVAKEDIARPKKYNVKDIIFLATILGLVSTVFDFIFFGMFYNVSPGVLQTNWFIGSILTELVFLFSIRTRHFFLNAPSPTFPIFILTSTAFMIAIFLPFTIFGQDIFHFVKPTMSSIRIILGITAAYFMSTEVVKLLFYHLNQVPKK